MAKTMAKTKAKTKTKTLGDMAAKRMTTAVKKMETLLNTARKRKQLKFEKDQHRIAGALLKKMRDDLLLGIGPEICSVYGRDVHKLVTQAVDAVDKLRCAMDNRVAAETTREEWDKEQLFRLYYPDSSKPTNLLAKATKAS